MRGYQDNIETVTLTPLSGVVEVDLSQVRFMWRHSIQVIPSLTPDSGRLYVSRKIPGASSFAYLDSIDLADPTKRSWTLRGATEAFRLWMVGLDADKAVDVVIHSVA